MVSVEYFGLTASTYQKLKIPNFNSTSLNCAQTRHWQVFKMLSGAIRSMPHPELLKCIWDDFPSIAYSELLKSNSKHFRCTCTEALYWRLTVNSTSASTSFSSKSTIRQIGPVPATLLLTWKYCTSDWKFSGGSFRDQQKNAHFAIFVSHNNWHGALTI